jgi:hypothetical protein
MSVIAVFAPIPTARDATVNSANVGCGRRLRSA